MSVEVTMPQLSDTMSEGTILNWLKKEGDYVKRGDALAEVATDKADLEIESFHEGTLVRINTPTGAKVKVGTVIAVIGDASAEGRTDNITTRSDNGSSAPPKIQPPLEVKTPEPKAVPLASGSSEEDRIKVSPLARNVAKAHGIDLAHIHGSGDGGRIVRRDIESLIDNLSIEEREPHLDTSIGVQAAVQTATHTDSPKSATTAVSTPSVTVSGTKHFEPLSRMRTVIAQRMVESVTTAPHFYVTARILMGEATRLRNSLKSLPQYEGITFNHLIIKAASQALRSHPVINSAFKDGGVVQPEDINIGIVTAVQGGLLIPVVKRADQQTLADLVADARGLVQRARAGRPKQEDLVEGTFSISNMGAFAVESFTAIISPGQGAILAVSSIQQEPVVIANELSIAEVMRVTLSVDHRIIDGVMAGAFLTDLKRLLEDPVLLLA